MPSTSTPAFPGASSTSSTGGILSGRTQPKPTQPWSRGGGRAATAKLIRLPGKASCKRLRHQAQQPVPRRKHQAPWACIGPTNQEDPAMAAMASESNVTAPTQFLEVRGQRYTYRRFGGGSAPPLLCLQHFTGTLDNWDPAVTDPLAANREVILFENAG